MFSFPVGAFSIVGKFSSKDFKALEEAFHPRVTCHQKDLLVGIYSESSTRENGIQKALSVKQLHDKTLLIVLSTVDVLSC
jgi:hypothetical protein